MKRTLIGFLLLSLAGCSGAPREDAFAWPHDAVAISDEQTAIMVSLAVFRGMLHRDIGDLAQVARKLHAFRYRTKDLAHDPNGDAWFVEPTPEENANFAKACGGRCIGGDLYTMALSAHDGRVLEMYIPQ